MPKPKPLAGRVALVTGAGSGIGKAIAERLAAEGACVVVADLDEAGATAVAEGIGTTDRAIAVVANVTDADAVQAAVDAAALAFGGVDLVVNNAGLSISKPLLETTEKDWDLQHDVMAKGSFLVSRAAAKAMVDQQMGGDIVYISSKNSVFAGPEQRRLRRGQGRPGPPGAAARRRARASTASGSTASTPTASCAAPGIFAKGWGAQRAAVYGVDEKDLGEFYAQRTILKREVLPEHVAAAVFALAGGDLTHTTGLHVPVDAGVAAGFLR